MKIKISTESINVSIESKQPEQKEKDIRYIFVRLYNPKYANFGIGKSFLQFGQTVTADKNWKVLSAHAAIALNLKDKFYGLSIFNGDAHLKPESCKGYSKGYISNKEYDLEKSEYTVIGFKCTTEEYNIAKREISNAYYGKTVKFDPVFAGLNMTLYSIGRKIKQTFSKSSDKSKESLGDLSKSDTTVTKEEIDTVKKICSTFVASVLFTSIKSLKAHFEKKENKKIGKYVSPSDIANFPGAKILFSGKFNTYTKDAEKFVSEHPEFKIYL